MLRRHLEARRGQAVRPTTVKVAEGLAGEVVRRGRVRQTATKVPTVEVRPCWSSHTSGRGSRRESGQTASR